MPFQNDILGGASGQGGAYDIDYSLRTDGGSDAHFEGSSERYLSRSVSAQTGDSQRKFTLSCWIKLSSGATFSTDQLSVPYRCIYAWADGNGDSAIGLNNTSSTSGMVNLEIVSVDSGGGYYYRWLSDINFLLRDQNAWYHLVVQIDTTQASIDNRIRAWVNNEQITSWATQYRPDQNQDVYINGAGHVMLTNYIGAAFRTVNSTIYNPWDGYIAELHALDGILKVPTDFAETDAATNMWKAIEYDGTYGTTGIYQKYGNTEQALAIVDSSIKTTSTTTFTTTAAITCDVLVVGGGGGGGNLGGAGSGGAGAGGGAGGFRETTSLALGSGTAHNIMVGFGGGGGKSGYRMQPESVDNAGSQNKWGQGHHGGPSGFGDYVVDGGGGGGSQDTGPRPYGLWGEYSQTNGTFTGRIPMTGSAGGGGTEAYGTGGGAYGNNGGNYPTRPSPGAGTGGGGGAGAAGSPGVSGAGGNGGAGSANAYQTGSNITYAGGGGGGQQGNGSGPFGSGGSGGGGNGSNGGSGVQGTNGLGGGGGGGGNQSAPNGGGSGGSGVVIVRYLANSAQATGGTITTYGSGGSQYYVHTFDTVNTRPTHLFILRGAVTLSDAQSKVGTSSFYFDGTTGTQISAVTQVKQIAGTTSVEDDFKYAADTAFCYEYWVRPTDVSGSHYHLSNYCLSSSDGGSGDGNNVELGMYTSGTDLRVRIDDTDRISGVATVAADTWYHVAVTRNTSNVVTLWLDGVSKGTYTADQTIGNTRSSLYIGSRYKASAGGSAIDEFDGYLDEIIISNTVRHTSTFTPSTTAFTADANTLVLMQSDWGGGLGADSSGNNNGMAVVGFAATDQMIDSPQNQTGGNFATFNGLLSLNEPAFNYKQLFAGNLKAVNNTSTSNDNFIGSIMPLDGKWYAEAYVELVASNFCFALANQHHSAEAGANADPDIIRYRSDGQLGNQGASFTSFGNSYTTGDILMVAWDADNNKMWFGKNGTWEASGNPATGANPAATMSITPYKNRWSLAFTPMTTSACTIVANFGADSSFYGNATAQGNTDGNDCGDFYYAPPTGHLALCENNLPEPAIKKPSDYFGNIIYTGDGNSPSPTRVFGFQPDFVWIKERGGTEANAWFDSPRGTNNQMRSNTTGMQTTNAETLKTFAATGFTTGSDDVVNTNTDTYVAYGWLGGGAPTVDNSAGAGNTPTAGSVKINGSNYGSAMAGNLEVKRLSANTTSGFSVCNFVGNETAGATVPHGLAVVPEWVIAKVYVQGSGASTSVWYSQPLTVGSDSQGHGSMSFDQGAFDDYAGYWNDVAPNSSIVTLGAYSNLNRSSNVLMYCFHSVEGYSMFGSYQGNGDNNGKFIYTGFRPKFFLTKNMTQSEHWNHWDDAREPNFNKLNKKLALSENAAEYTANTTSYAVDFVSNGVKLRSSYSSLNDNNDYFFYAAFAEWPFKYTRAR